MRTMSLHHDHEEMPADQSQTSSRLRSQPLAPSLGLPALTSSEWGFEELKLPPGPKGG